MSVDKPLEEASYGIIPLKKIDGIWHMLLIKHQDGHWAFPKGHPEPGEEPLQTASRELREETGLTITKLYKADPLQEKYQFYRGKQLVIKTVTYFLAEVAGELVLQLQEISDSIWVQSIDACEIATYTDAKSLCQKILSILSK